MGRRLFATLCAAFLLVSSLLGCGSAVPEDRVNDYVGTWAIEGVTSGGDEVTGDELDLYKAMGVYLIVGSDYTVLYEVFGMSVSGTFEIGDSGEAAVTFSESESADAGVSAKQTLQEKDGKLYLKDEKDEQSFVQIDPSDKKSADVSALLGNVDESNLEETLGSLREDLQNAADGTFPLTDAEELDEMVASDKNCSIKVRARGSYLGDPGYLLEIENKGTARIVVSDDGAFTVNGQEVDPVLMAVIDPGNTSREVLWFEGDSLSLNEDGELGEVRGKLVATNYETGEKLGTYDFSL
jgi:hypothetical protein